MRTFRERRESTKVENYPEARSKLKDDLKKGEFKRALSQLKSCFCGGRAAKKKRARKKI